MAGDSPSPGSQVLSKMQSVNSQRLKNCLESTATGASRALALAGILQAGVVSICAAPAPKQEIADVAATSPRIFIREYQVTGAKLLSEREIGEAVYPFLGPGRTPDDVDQARAALENIYKEKGYQSVSVEIPEQDGRGGVVFLNVVENKVGKLRVKGSRFLSLAKIKDQAPSLREGVVPNFNDVTRDIAALNTWPDRRVTPSLQAGEEPGTVDIDLTVEDTFPLHGSVELNNRYSPNTTPLRLDGALSYNNLWQLGHSLGGNFQISPENLDEVKVFSAYYTARFASLPWLSVTAQATKQDSNVSTLGSIASAGRGEIVGLRASFTLPQKENFYHSLTFGIDYKDFEQTTTTLELPDGLPVEIIDQVPVTYVPFSIAYNATWAGKGYTTEFNAGLTVGLRAFGSDPVEFDNARHGADGSFVHLRGTLAHTHEVFHGAEIYGQIQGQIAGGPLVTYEQFGGGGAGTVRGYLEGEVFGDNAIVGTFEVRTPQLLGWLPGKGHEWRLYAFVDAALLTLHEPLPEQEDRFELASFGVGSRMQLFEYLNGSIDLALPLIDQGRTDSYDPFLSFRIWAEF